MSEEQAVSKQGPLKIALCIYPADPDIAQFSSNELFSKGLKYQLRLSFVMSYYELFLASSQNFSNFSLHVIEMKTWTSAVPE